MEVTLVVIRGKVNRGEIAFQPPAILGRSREADLTIAHPMVSRHHCELFEVNGLLMIRDLGSLNGTMIDGRRVVQAALCPDEAFSVGPLTFQVRYQYDGDRDAVPPPTLAEPLKADQSGRTAPAGSSPQSTETPEFSGIGPKVEDEPAAELGPWSNDMPAEEESPWSSSLPTGGSAVAEPADEIPQFNPRGESAAELPTGMQGIGAESPEPSFPAEEFVPAAPAEETEDAEIAGENEEPEPEKKRGFRLWPFGGR